MSVIVVDVGCLECGEPSLWLGIFPTVQEARLVHPDAIGPNPDSAQIRGQSQRQILNLESEQ